MTESHPCGPAADTRSSPAGPVEPEAESIGKSRTATFPARFESLSEIDDFVARHAQAAGLEPSDVFAVQLAVDEACSNIIEHAYGGEGSGDLECTCQIGEDGLTVVLRDHGQPFDPDRVPSPRLDAPLKEREAGGLGLHFMRRLMDEIRFAFSAEGGNVLTMIKRRRREE